MKKLLALVLAMAMVIGMASVSFAAYGDAEYLYLYGPLWYDEDTDRFEHIQYNTASKFAEYGETIYWELWDTDDSVYFDGRPLTDSEEVEKMKVKFNAEMGGELVESVEIVKMRTYNWYYIDESYNDAYGEEGDKYYSYYVAMKIADAKSTTESDIIGVFEIDRKKDNKKGIDEIKELKIDAEVSVLFDRSWSHPCGLFLVKDKVDLRFDEKYALKFDSDDEVELVFGAYEGSAPAEQNEGVFTVDASGQGKVFIEWNTTPDEAIAAANEGAVMHFVNFGGVKFNRAGEFVYELEDAAAAYQVVDGKLAAIPGVEIDDGEITFHTNKLGSYVFAKSELVNP